MGMTHYMELMMSSWYLLVLFMALPMFLAECYVVSEILLLLNPKACPKLRTFNRWSAYVAAVVIAVLAAYAARYFLQVQQWRTWVDVTAAVAYVVAGLPFLYVALLEAGLAGRARSAVSKGHAAVAAVVLYLIFSHAAMVFGMFDPVQFGYQGSEHAMHGMHHETSTTPHEAAHHHEGGQPSHAHCGGMTSDLSGMVLPQGHPVPEGYHRMPDGRLMKNGAMTPAPTSGHHCP